VKGRGEDSNVKKVTYCTAAFMFFNSSATTFSKPQCLFGFEGSLRACETRGRKKGEREEERRRGRRVH
jgi:hypothetical protein